MMPFSSIADLSNFYYGCIHYFLGNYDISYKLLKEEDCRAFGTKNKYNILKLNSALINIIELEQDYLNIKTIRERADYKNNIPTLLIEINKELTNIINNKKYYDDKAYKRNWFTLATNSITTTHVNQRIGVIILFILRGFCDCHQAQFDLSGRWGKSKRGLNDLAQADTLWHDLFYYSRTISTGKDIFKYTPVGFQLYTDECKTSYDSILFLLRCIIDIIRANIYRQICFLENSLDNYFHAIRLYEGDVTIDSKMSEHSPFLCPMIPKALYEVSKLLFDKGQIIESLIAQLKSIKYILMISYKITKNKEITKLIKCNNKTLKILTYLQGFLGNSIRKDMLLSLFIEAASINSIQNIIRQGGENVKTILLEDTPLISPALLSRVTGDIIEDLKPTLADVLARIGFTLFTIKLGVNWYRVPEGLQNKFKEINIGEQQFEHKNNYISNCIKSYLYGYGGYESELGNYTLTLMKEPNIEFISHRIERVFSASVVKKLDLPQSDEERLCSKIIRHSLTNVGNIAAIPLRVDHFLAQEGYHKRRPAQFKSRSTINKLVVLRRWQSFNPKVPRPKGQDIRGGGYFLIWNKKGIVIDPGYDFIKNFYEEGYSIDDIDAIIVTHTHPDHEDELNTIITLLAEWNQYQKKQKYILDELVEHQQVDDKKNKAKEGAKDKEKSIDLFLNEGAYRKYNSWLYGKDIMIRKIYLLQSSLWDKTSKESSDMQASEANNPPIIDLRYNYNMEIEVIPAWHDELIDKHSSVGFIFRLYNNVGDKDPEIRIGFTGDTEVYDEIEHYYKNVDILIAHLGDIKLRELLVRLDNGLPIINEFIRRWFKIQGMGQEQLKEKFMDYLSLQDLYGVEEKYIKDNVNAQSIKEQFKLLKKCQKASEIIDCFKLYYLPNSKYKYKNHLGITGIFKLYKALLSKEPNQPSSQNNKLMIIGELPEELQSYRHILACIMEEHKVAGGYQGRCFTGDVGLTIGLPSPGIKYGRPGDPHPNFSIRCLKCFQNNEYIAGLKSTRKDDINYYLPHYHPIDRIQETCLKACSSRIVWLCHDFHARTPDYSGQEFLIDPDLRAVW